MALRSPSESRSRCTASAIRPQSPHAARLVLNVFDGTRQLLASGVPLLVTIIDGNRRTIVRDYFENSSLDFPGLSVNGNFGDEYTVIVWAAGYQQAGFAPVRLSPQVVQVVDLMLLPKESAFSFAEARWATLKAGHQELWGLLCEGAGEEEACQRYSMLLEDHPERLACLLNITTAMSQIHLPTGTPLAYLCELVWDDTMACDRFFAWAHPDFLNQVRIAASHGTFAEEPAPNTFHGGATCSYKQVSLGEANIQLTFHENDKKVIEGATYIKVEPDIDYYRDLGAHAILEVVPNTITGGLTNPKDVYALLWIAGQRAGLPEFTPPYTIIKA